MLHLCGCACISWHTQHIPKNGKASGLKPTWQIWCAFQNALLALMADSKGVSGSHRSEQACTPVQALLVLEAQPLGTTIAQPIR